jgi:hypothetical protein
MRAKDALQVQAASRTLVVVSQPPFETAVAEDVSAGKKTRNRIRRAVSLKDIIRWKSELGFHADWAHNVVISLAKGPNRIRREMALLVGWVIGRVVSRVTGRSVSVVVSLVLSLAVSLAVSWTVISRSISGSVSGIVNWIISHFGGCWCKWSNQRGNATGGSLHLYTPGDIRLTK